MNRLKLGIHVNGGPQTLGWLSDPNRNVDDIFKILKDEINFIYVQMKQGRWSEYRRPQDG